MTNGYTERILKLVSTLRLGEGDRLPGEREMAQQLGTSRNTVRESLVALAAQGQIEIRKRSGCYLVSMTPPTPWRNLHVDEENTVDALRAVGPHLASRAAKRCAPEQARRLESLTARLGQHLVNHDAANIASEYICFFAALASLAGNPYLELLMKEIMAARGNLGRAATMDKVRTETFFELHISLLQAIQSHDARRAYLLAAHGLDAFIAILAQAKPQTKEGTQ